MKQDITVEHAVKVLTEALRDDAELYQAYKEKVATAVMSTIARYGELEEVFASRIAAKFLKNWINETMGSGDEQAAGVSLKAPVTKYKNKDGWEYVLMDDGRFHATNGTNVFYHEDGSRTITPWYPLIYTREQCEQHLTPVTQDSHKEGA